MPALVMNSRGARSSNFSGGTRPNSWPSDRKRKGTSLQMGCQMEEARETMTHSRSLHEHDAGSRHCKAVAGFSRTLQFASRTPQIRLMKMVGRRDDGYSPEVCMGYRQAK